MTAVATTIPYRDPDVTPVPRVLAVNEDAGDRRFQRGTLLTGLIVLAVMAAVGLFLAVEATEALRVAGIGFLTTSEWAPESGDFGVASVLAGTVLVALVAVSVALPISLGVSLFIAEVAPPRLRGTFVALVDLMAAVPSVVYGLWGLFLFQGAALGVARWLAKWLGWLPFFDVTGADPNDPLATATVYTASMFVAGLVVALMVMPIQASIMREVFSQVPVGEREGAFALGATRWGMIRIVSLPFARGGIIGGTMLGLGRALGETIAVLLILSPDFTLKTRILESGGVTASYLIGSRYAEATDFSLSALMAAGLALFIVTLAVNFTASAFVARSRSGASSEA